MRALVVYESMFGNTREVAEAIAAGIRNAMEVETVEVGAAPAEVPEGIDLLVVGGPTHAHGLTRHRTRNDAALRAPAGVISPTIGVREWLEALPPTRVPMTAAAFDTRIHAPEVLTG